MRPDPDRLGPSLILKAQILAFDRRIMACHRSNETSKRLDAIPGAGPALATALVASIGDPKAFRSGRDFSAWIGRVPKQNSSGGKDKLGNISKQGDRYLRSLFTAGALAVIRYAKLHGTKHRPWLAALPALRPTKVAAIALANKIARMPALPRWHTTAVRRVGEDVTTLAPHRPERARFTHSVPHARASLTMSWMPLEPSCAIDTH
jgi:hypothetical protein